MIDEDPAAPPTEPDADPYRVLARKYRPATFAELIGQAAMVRTLTNAMASGRMAHAFVLTGVRGVGKTTTARIIARALNCVGLRPEGSIEPCGTCDSCVAIAEDRHVDIIEMDAASRTGVDDIREIIEGVRYAPVSARFKVYIIDEVHMLSRNAFNALLKTLEEPPEHVKFIFATTEIRKVPVTVLSRCQRFDLRRVDADDLGRHLAAIAAKEGIAVDAEPLAMIARAADGSVRDALSLLDHAITLGDGRVAGDTVRDMLGLADRTRIHDLFDFLVRGEARDGLAVVDDLMAAGADPIVVLQDLLEFTHFVTRAKLTPEILEAPGLPEVERTRGHALAERLTQPILSRAWQILLKGVGEVQAAPAPAAALEMVLIRLVHAAHLPTPAEVLRRLEGGGFSPGSASGSSASQSGPGQGPSSGASGVRTADRAEPSAVLPGHAPPGPAPPRTVTTDTPVSTAGGASGPPGAASARIRAVPTEAVAEAAPRNQSAESPAPVPGPTPAPASFAELVDLFQQRDELLLHASLSNDAHLVHYEPGRLQIRVRSGARSDLANRVATRLREWTGHHWLVVVSDDPGEPTLREQADAERRRLEQEVSAHPLVSAVLEAFPGATIQSIYDPTALDEPSAEDDGDQESELDDGSGNNGSDDDRYED